MAILEYEDRLAAARECGAALQSELAALRELAGELAETDPEHDGSCWHCGAALRLENHFASCLWLRAQRWKRGSDGLAGDGEGGGDGA
jgi:hypothetical protein